MTALQDAVDSLARLNCQPIRTADGFDAYCPLHEADGKSHKRSLGIKAGDTVPVVVNCRAGCDGKEILKVLGINGTSHKSTSIVATYRYQDANGADIREKLRYEPKDFRIRHRDAAGSWAYKAGDGSPVLYRLPEVKAAIEQGQTIFVCEGEKDCDRLASAGLVATTNIEGAAKPEQRPKWKTEYTAQLSGAARVVLVPDNDAPGKAHMKHIAVQLAGKVGEVRWLELPGLSAKGDVSDWLNGGHSIEDLKALAMEAPPAEPEPAREPGTAEAPIVESGKPVIRVESGRLPWITDEAEKCLTELDDGIFQRSDCLVRWAISRQETVHGIHRPGGTAIIKPIDVDHLLDRLGKIANWVRWSERAKGLRPANVPKDVALTLLARSGLWDFPRLVGVITAPTLRPDGSILEKPGYDAKTGLLFVRQQEFPPIPDKPSKADGRAALDFILREVLAGFPFVETYHRSAALSAALSVTVRHILRHVPLHAFTAPKAGSGKSLLADCIAMIGTGYPAAILALSEDQAEMNKAITAILMQGDAVVNLDNIERGEALAGRELSKALTQEIYSGRVLGASKVVSLPSCCLWLATGNQLQISGDMTRRVIPCEIDPECERPDEREFSRDLYEWVPANRAALVVAALTALRAYIVAGKPRQDFKPLGGFADWSGLVRSALVWLGEEDPLTGRDSIEDADPERAKLRSLLLAWHHAFRTAPATSKEAIFKATPRTDPQTREEIIDSPELRDALLEFFKDRNGNINSRLLGEYLGQNARRIESGARFETDGLSHNVKLWKVVITHPDRFEKCNKGGLGGLGGSFGITREIFAVNEKMSRCMGEVRNTRGEGETTPQTPQTPRPDSRGGTAGTAGTQNSVEPLAVELAALAGLDVAAMLAGRLVTDSEWAAFVAGLAKLNTRHPDKADEIAALVDRVITAAESLEGAP